MKKAATRRAKATVKTPVRDLTNRETVEHYNAVLIEEIKDQMKQVLEAVDTSVGGVRQELGEFRKETHERFNDVEAVLHEHSRSIAELKTDVSCLKTDVSCLKTGMTTMKADMTSMEQSLRSEIRASENRLSQKIEATHARLDDHEVRITSLENAS